MPSPTSTSSITLCTATVGVSSDLRDVPRTCSGPFGKYRRPRRTHRSEAEQTRPVRMHADDVVVLQPEIDDGFDVRRFERLVERVLALLGRSEQQRLGQAGHDGPVAATVSGP